MSILRRNTASRSFLSCSDSVPNCPVSTSLTRADLSASVLISMNTSDPKGLTQGVLGIPKRLTTMLTLGSLGSPNWLHKLFHVYVGDVGFKHQVWALKKCVIAVIDTMLVDQMKRICSYTKLQIRRP